MIDTAYAMAAPGGTGGGDLSTLMSFAPMILIFGVFYFLLIRPQQKKAKEHRMLLENLKKGDAVLTNGGLYGKVTALTDQVVTLEIAEKVRVRVSRGAIAGLAPSGAELNS
jgi:preprotein translocase subunit YajC